MDAPGNFGAVDGSRPPSLDRVSDRSFHRGIVVGLFVVDVFAGVYTLFAAVWTTNVYLTAVPRGVAAYWVAVAVLALLSFGMVWNVRAEARAGRSFGAGILLCVLSFFPLVFGVAMLFWSRE
jgi:hypothetical protein